MVVYAPELHAKLDAFSINKAKALRSPKIISYCPEKKINLSNECLLTAGTLSKLRCSAKEITTVMQLLLVREKGGCS